MTVEEMKNKIPSLNAIYQLVQTIKQKFRKNNDFSYVDNKILYQEAEDEGQLLGEGEIEIQFAPQDDNRDYEVIKLSGYYGTEPIYLNGIAEPTLENDAANKKYIDDKFSEIPDVNDLNTLKEQTIQIGQEDITMQDPKIYVPSMVAIQQKTLSEELGTLYHIAPEANFSLSLFGASQTWPRVRLERVEDENNKAHFAISQRDSLDSQVGNVPCRLSGIDTPINNTDAVNKEYVDNKSQVFQEKDILVVLETNDINISLDQDLIANFYNIYNSPNYKIKLNITDKRNNATDAPSGNPGQKCSCYLDKFNIFDNYYQFSGIYHIVYSNKIIIKMFTILQNITTNDLNWRVNVIQEVNL